jgi:hypothetical protein
MLPTYMSYLERYPGRLGFMEALDLKHVVDITSGDEKCYEANLCGIMKVAVHLSKLGRLYVRALDFTLINPSFSTDAAVRERAVEILLRGKEPSCRTPDEVVRCDITNYTSALNKELRASKAAVEIVKTFRQELGDPSAAPTVTMTRPTRRNNHQFFAIEILPHLLSQLGFYESPPDPAWAPVWKVIKSMELLGSCPLAEPKMRMGKGAAKRVPQVAIQAELQTELAEVGEICTEDVPDSLMQLTRPKLCAMVRVLQKEKADLRARIADDSTKDVNEAARKMRETISKTQYKLRESQAAVNAIKAEKILLERELNDRKRIEHAIDFSNVEIPPEGLRLMNSYESLYKDKTPEQVKTNVTDREYIVHKAIRELEKAKQEIVRRGKIMDEYGMVIIKKETDCQTDCTWTELTLAEKLEAQKSQMGLIAERVRSDCVPALRGREAEDRLMELLVAMAPTNCSVVLTRSTGHCGDYMLIFRADNIVSGYAIIDCKSYTAVVPTKQVEKLQSDIDYCTEQFKCPPRWAAIVSIDTDIVHNGSAGASDFIHKSTLVLLLHSTNSKGDNGSSSIRDMLHRSEFIVNLLPVIQLSEESSVLIDKFEKSLIAGRKQGRGRSHSQARKSVSFTKVEEVVQPHGEEIQQGSTVIIAREVLDSRIFVPSSQMSASELNIATLISRKYEYKEGNKIKGVDLKAYLMKCSGLSESSVKEFIKAVLLEGIRQGHSLINLFQKVEV